MKEGRSISAEDFEGSLREAVRLKFIDKTPELEAAMRGGKLRAAPGGYGGQTGGGVFLICIGDESPARGGRGYS